MRNVVLSKACSDYLYNVAGHHVFPWLDGGSACSLVKQREDVRNFEWNIDLVSETLRPKHVTAFANGTYYAQRVNRDRDSYGFLPPNAQHSFFFEWTDAGFTGLQYREQRIYFALLEMLDFDCHILGCAKYLTQEDVKQYLLEHVGEIKCPPPTWLGVANGTFDFLKGGESERARYAGAYERAIELD